LCEVELKRAAFKIESDCQDFWKKDQINFHYFISQITSKSVTFLGENGLSAIELNGSWFLKHNFNNGSMTMLGKFSNPGSYPLIGLNEWIVNDCGQNHTAQIKLTNVSSS